jgi:hypothetical protein
MNFVIHPVQAAQEGGLPAAGGADERGDLLFFDVKADIEERLLGAVEKIKVFDLDLIGIIGVCHKCFPSTGHTGATHFGKCIAP